MINRSLPRRAIRRLVAELREDHLRLRLAALHAAPSAALRQPVRVRVVQPTAYRLAARTGRQPQGRHPYCR